MAAAEPQTPETVSHLTPTPSLPPRLTHTHTHTRWVSTQAGTQDVKLPPALPAGQGFDLRTRKKERKKKKKEQQKKQQQLVVVDWSIECVVTATAAAFASGHEQATTTTTYCAHT